jgi:RNA polymerase-binding transcription factor DksA
MSMSVGQRRYFAEMLRRGRDESLLILAAGSAVAERQRRRRLARRQPEISEAESALLEHEARRLVAIAEAQDVIREIPELFGVCEACGDAIAQQRLDAAPWITRCAAHAHEIALPVC